MKKSILAASGLFLAASMYIGVNSYKNLNSGTDLLLANVEALSDGEQIFEGYKNRWLGAVPGCKKAPNYICDLSGNSGL